MKPPICPRASAQSTDSPLSRAHAITIPDEASFIADAPRDFDFDRAGLDEYREVYKAFLLTVSSFSGTRPPESNRKQYVGSAGP